jgi:hypothetical protein
MYKEFNEELYLLDSYCGYIFMNFENILIPCINVGVSNHPLNPKDKLQFLDYSYLIFHNVSTVTYSPKIDLIKSNSKESFYFGAFDIIGKRSFEINIQCDEISFIPVENYQISDNMWIPIKTPNFEANILFEDVLKFITTPPTPLTRSRSALAE